MWKCIVIVLKTYTYIEIVVYTLKCIVIVMKRYIHRESSIDVNTAVVVRRCIYRERIEVTFIIKRYILREIITTVWALLKFVCSHEVTIIETCALYQFLLMEQTQRALQCVE